MKINILAAFSVAFGLLAGAALAKPMPEPPPSGIVVHLFGPDSITSNILPQAAPPAAPAANAPVEGAAPAAAVPPMTSNGAVQPAGPGGTVQPAAAPAAAGYQGPSLHDVLHQMFVTGDPNITPREKLAPGRAKDRPQ